MDMNSTTPVRDHSRDKKTPGHMSIFRWIGGVLQSVLRFLCNRRFLRRTALCLCALVILTCLAVLINNARERTRWAEAKNKWESKGEAFDKPNVFPSKVPDEDAQLSTASEYYWRGSKHERKRHFDKALDDYTKAIELDPRFIDAYWSRSSIYAHQKNDHRSAISDLSKILEINPHLCTALHNRGLYHQGVREYDRAIDDFTSVLDPRTDFSGLGGSKEKHRALAYHYRGKIYHWHKEDYAKAVADYTDALRLDPYIRMVLYRRGRAYYALQKYEEAERDFTAALKRRPNYPNLLASWAWQLATCPEEKFRDGPKALQLALKANKKLVDPRHIDTLAAAYAENGKFDEAIATEKTAIELVKYTDDQLQKAMEKRLELYKAKRPFRDE